MANLDSAPAPKRPARYVSFMRDDTTNTTYLNLGAPHRVTADSYPAGLVPINRPRDIHRIAAQIRGAGRNVVVRAAT